MAGSRTVPGWSEAKPSRPFSFQGQTAECLAGRHAQSGDEITLANESNSQATAEDSGIRCTGQSKVAWAHVAQKIRSFAQAGQLFGLQNFDTEWRILPHITSARLARTRLSQNMHLQGHPIRPFLWKV